MFCQRLTCLIKWRSLSCTERSTLMNICRNVLTVSNNSKSSDCNRAWKLQHLSSTSLTLKSNEPRPVIRRPNQVLVQVYASSVNPIDVLLSDGYGNRCFETIHVLDSCREAKISYDRFPLTIGRDFAGVVVATGTNVDHVRVGDRVWGAASPWQSGSHTDLLLTDSCHVGLAPSRIDLEPAASIPYSALTVWSSLGVAQLNASNAMRKRVLVVGASGGLGQIAVQILKGWRCYVTAVCSASAIEQLSMNRLPADRLFAYDTEQLELNQLRNEFDAILDYRPADSQPTLVYAQSLKANFSSFYVTASSPVLRHLDRDGWILGSACIALDLAGLHVKAAQSGRHVRWAFYHPNRCGLNELARLVDEDIVQAPLDRMFDFDQVPQAYEAMASGHSRGRIVIRHKS